MAIIDSVKKILVENVGADEASLTEETTLDSLEIDSLDMVELICDLEEAEDIDFGEPEGLQTIGDIVAHIESCK